MPYRVYPPVAGLEPSSGSQRGIPDDAFTGPDDGFGVPDDGPGPTHSVPQYSVPLRSVGQFEDDEEPNPNGQTKDAPKEEIKEFYFQGKWRPYKRSSA